jgi:hypothetical protein
VTEIRYIHHHHHVHEGLGVFPVPWSSRGSWSLYLFLSRPMLLRPCGLYCSDCFGNLFVSILCTCCNRFSWYCFISFTMFRVPVFSLIQWLFSWSSFVTPSKGLKNVICAASKRCSSLFFSTQDSLPNLNADLSVMLWILNSDDTFGYIKIRLQYLHTVRWQFSHLNFIVLYVSALQLLGTRGWRRRAANRDEWRHLMRNAKARKGL